MTSNYISYDFNPPYISILKENEIKSKLENAFEELQQNVVYYTDQKLLDQEAILFNLPDFKDKEKDKNLFLKTIEKFIDDIKKDNNYPNIKSKIINLKDLKNEELKITYNEMCGLVNTVIYIFENMEKKKKADSFVRFYCCSVFPTMKKNDPNVAQIIQLDKAFRSIKKITVCLSNEKKTKEKYAIDIKIILFFCLFCKVFLINLLYLEVDLNIYEINEYFNLEINPYKINEEEVLRIGNAYKNIFLGNLIIMNKLTKIETLNKVKFKMFDSYQIELHQILSKFLNNENNNQNQIIENGSSDKNKYLPAFQNKILFFDHILPKVGREFYELTIDFNSLDPLLFTYINNLLLRFSNIANISLKFFSFNKTNLRKTIINAYYYNLYSKNKKNPFPMKYYPEQSYTKWDNDHKIFYNYIDNINDNKNKNFLILKEEVLINDIFPFFNYNLNSLLVIIEKKINDTKNSVNSLYLDFRNVNNGNINLNLYNNYNTSIVCFLFNLLNILEANKTITNLRALDLFLDDLSNEKEYIIKNIFHKIPLYKEGKVFNLKELKLTHFSLDFSNISLILPFSNFPMEKLTELILDNISYVDLDNLVKALKNNNNKKDDEKLFKKLIYLEIGLNYMIEDFRKNIEILLTECILNKLESFILKIPSYISFNDIIDIITWIRKGHNKKASIQLKLSNSELSPNINDDDFGKSVEAFKKYSKKEFQKRNILSDIYCKDKNSFDIGYKVLDANGMNYYLKFIYSFNKLLEKNGKKVENNRKIFENIFYYMGKFRKDNKIIKIEII